MTAEVKRFLRLVWQAYNLIESEHYHRALMCSPCKTKLREISKAAVHQARRDELVVRWISGGEIGISLTDKGLVALGLPTRAEMAAATLVSAPEEAKQLSLTEAIS